MFLFYYDKIRYILLGFCIYYNYIEFSYLIILILFFFGENYYKGYEKKFEGKS